ncbi:MAG: PaaX family transcriptional regulator [Pseudomonadales bacterium]|nr:PaaX family transcriptional regulator [Pseudomonadales bacterium]
MEVLARQLILDMVMVRHPLPCPVHDLLLAGRVFAMTDNSIRVTVTRLVTQGHLSTAGRGLYVMGPSAEHLAQELRNWRQAESRLRAWDGHYLLVYTGDMSRSDRSALRRQERALAMLGFREVRRGLSLRPDNLDASLADVRERLQALGLPLGAMVARLDGLESSEEAVLRDLWPLQQLDENYRQLNQKLQNWLNQAASLTTEQAARESFVWGREAIHQVLFDPLLPDSWIDAQARRMFFQGVIAFDEFGQNIWRQFLQQTQDEAGLY